MASPDPRPFLQDPRALNRPWFESPFFERLLAAQDVSPERAAMVRRFREDGYLVVEGLFEGELIDRILERYPWMFDPATRFEAPPDVVHRLTRAANRRQDAWAVVPAVRELACHDGVLDLLRFLYGREPVPFQTLNFLPGTEQSMHADAFHFLSVPAGFLCGVWVALEDITTRNGPLMYARGSHRLPAVELTDLKRWADRQDRELGPNYEIYEDYVRSVLEATDPPIERLTCPKGTALIWAANLLHGGSPIEDPGSTRKSQVTHYYFEDCVYYKPVHSDVALGEYALREVRDIRTEALVPHRLNGQALRVTDVGYEGFELFRVQREPEDAGGAEADPLAKLEGERNKLRETVEVLTRETEAMRAHVETVEAELEAGRTHVATVEAELAAGRTHVATVERDNAEMKAHVRSVEEESERRGQHIDTVEQDARATRAHADTLEREHAQMREHVAQERDRLDEHLRVVDAERASLRAHLATVERELAALRAHVETVERENEARGGHIASVDADNAAMRGHIATIEQENAAMRGHIETLERMMSRTGAKTLYRIGRRIKDTFVRPRRDGAD